MFFEYFLTWMAYIFCCLAVVSLLVVPVNAARPIYSSNLFLPTYTIGIFAWFLHGLEEGGLVIILPCAVQLVVLAFLMRRALSMRVRGKKNEL